jgi:hypothetical protein
MREQLYPILLVAFAFCLLPFAFRHPASKPRVVGMVADGELALEIAASVRSRF